MNNRPIIVQKYGGTSISNTKKIKIIAKYIKKNILVKIN